MFFDSQARFLVDRALVVGTLDKQQEERVPQFSNLENGDGTTCPKGIFR